MNFYIRRNSILPTLKMKLIFDGRNDYKRFHDLLDNSVVTFSMKNVNNGVYKVANKEGKITKVTIGDIDEYYVEYDWIVNDTNELGQFEGEFKIKFLDDCSHIIVPIRENLYVNVLTSFTKGDIEENNNLIDSDGCLIFCDDYLFTGGTVSGSTEFLSDVNICEGDLYVHNILGCSPITINNNLEVDENLFTISGETRFLNTLTGTTAYFDNIFSGNTELSELIINTFTTGVTLSGNTAVFNRNDGNSYNLDLTPFIDDTNTFVTGGTYSNNSITLTRNDNVNIVITGITDYFTTDSTFNPSTKIATFNRNDGNNYTLDLSTLSTVDTFVTGFTYDDNTNTFSINQNEGQSPLTATIDTISLSGSLSSVTFDIQTAGNITAGNFFGNGSSLSGINFSQLATTAHTHSISDVINLQTNLNSKIDKPLNPFLGDYLYYNGVNWVPNQVNIPVAAGAGVTLFLSLTGSSLPSYEYLSQFPVELTETQEPVVVNNSQSLIGKYATEQLNRTVIDSGIWEFNTFASVDTPSTGLTQIIISAFLLTSGGSETFLFSGATENITTTSPNIYTFSLAEPQYSCNTTDYLVVNYSASTTNNFNTTVTLYHGGALNYSHIHTPFVTLHNDLAGIQGGQSNQYYHLSKNEVDLLTTGVDSSSIHNHDSLYLSLGGGTVSGQTNFTSGLYSNSLSGDTIFSGGTLLQTIIQNIVSGNAVTGTTGSIAFFGAGNTITQDNSNFFWDNTNKRLGLLTNAPTSPLTIGNPLGTSFTALNNTGTSSFFSRIDQNNITSVQIRNATSGTNAYVADVFESTTTGSPGQSRLMVAALSNATTNEYVGGEGNSAVIYYKHLGNTADAKMKFAITDATSVNNIKFEWISKLQSTANNSLVSGIGAVGSYTPSMTLLGNGNLLIGTTGDTSSRLLVFGAGTTSSTFGLRVHNSTGTNNALVVRDDGLIRIGSNNFNDVNTKFRVDNGNFEFYNDINDFRYFSTFNTSSGTSSVNSLQCGAGSLTTVNSTNFSIYSYPNENSNTYLRGSVALVNSAANASNNTITRKILFFIHNNNDASGFEFNFSSTFSILSSSRKLFLTGLRGNLILGTNLSQAGTSATKTFVIENGTAPTGNLTDAFQQYSADIVAGNAAPHFRTENGSIIKLYTATGATTTQGIANALSNQGLFSSIASTYLTSGSTQANLLDNTSNWDINGNYIGVAITGTFQGQKYYNNNYFFEAVADNLWLRLLRG